MFFLSAVVLGCAHTREQSSPDVYVPSIATLKPEEYQGEIEKYNEIIRSDHNLRIQQHAHLYLASLYFSPMNPNRDYEPALKHLEDYAIYDPDFINAVDPRLLLAALIEIEKISALAEAQTSEIQALNQELEMLKRQALASRGNHHVIQKENKRLKKRISRLGKKVRKLETSNAQLNKTIEMLSKLDSRLEEKRSNFNNIDSTAEE
jgi:hypothetical protein